MKRRKIVHKAYPGTIKEVLNHSLVNTTHLYADHSDKIMVTDVRLEELFQIDRKTWQKWRVTGSGPRFVKISNRAVRYLLSDVMDWLNARKVASTSQALPK